MSALFEEMTQGTEEARAYMEGERKGYKVTLPESAVYGRSAVILTEEKNPRILSVAPPISSEEKLS